MSDISMCKGQDCPIRETCYRFKANPDPFRQAYASFKYDSVTQSCDHYWKFINYSNYTKLENEDRDGNEHSEY